MPYEQLSGLAEHPRLLGRWSAVGFLVPSHRACGWFSRASILTVAGASRRLRFPAGARVNDTRGGRVGLGDQAQIDGLVVDLTKEFGDEVGPERSGRGHEGLWKVLEGTDPAVRPDPN